MEANQLRLHEQNLSSLAHRPSSGVPGLGMGLGLGLCGGPNSSNPGGKANYCFQLTHLNRKHFFCFSDEMFLGDRDVTGARVCMDLLIFEVFEILNFF